MKWPQKCCQLFCVCGHFSAHMSSMHLNSFGANMKALRHIRQSRWMIMKVPKQKFIFTPYGNNFSSTYLSTNFSPESRNSAPPSQIPIKQIREHILSIYTYLAHPASTHVALSAHIQWVYTKVAWTFFPLLIFGNSCNACGFRILPHRASAAPRLRTQARSLRTANAFGQHFNRLTAPVPNAWMHHNDDGSAA